MRFLLFCLWATAACAQPFSFGALPTSSNSGQSVSGGGGTVTAPSFVQSSGVVNSSSTPKSAPAITVSAGNMLVAYAVSEDSPNTLSVSSSPTLAWTLKQSVVTSGFTPVYIWAATNNATQSITVTFTRTAGFGSFMGRVLDFHGSAGIGTSNKGNSASGNPSVTLSSVANHSAIVLCSGDWAAIAVTSRAYDTSQAGSFSELDAAQDSGVYSFYGGYYADTGTTGNKAIGLTAPSGQTWALVGLEVKGQ